MTFGVGRDVVTRLGGRGVSPTLEAVPSPNLFAAISPLRHGWACRRLSVPFSVNGLSSDAFFEHGREF